MHQQLDPVCTVPLRVCPDSFVQKSRKPQDENVWLSDGCSKLLYAMFKRNCYMSPPTSGLARHSTRYSITPNSFFHSSLTSQACDTVNSNPWGFRQPEDCDSWSFPLCFRAFLLLMVALAFMSTESSYLIRGAMGKSLWESASPSTSREWPVHRRRREKNGHFLASRWSVSWLCKPDWVTGGWLCLVFSRGLDSVPVQHGGNSEDDLRWESARYHRHFGSLCPLQKAKGI